MAAWCVACLVYWLLGVVVLAVPAAGCVFAAVVSVPAGWVFLLLCPCLLLGVLAGWVSVVFVAGAGCCPCCVYWLAGRWVKGKGERQYKINIPTQNIIYPPLEGGI